MQHQVLYYISTQVLYCISTSLPYSQIKMLVSFSTDYALCSIGTLQTDTYPYMRNAI